MGTDSIDEFLADFEGLDESEVPDLEQILEEVTEGARGTDDPGARNVASAMGVPADAVVRVVGGKEAGPDRGEVFYTFMHEGVGVAVRQDGLRAYVTDLLEETDRAAAVRGTLAKLNISLSVNGELPRLGDALAAASSCWVPVAEGRAPIPGSPKTIEYLNPAKPEEPLAADMLSLMSIELFEFLMSDSVDKEALKRLQTIGVVPGDLVARGVPVVKGEAGTDVFGREVSPGLETEQSKMEVGISVSVDEDGAYRAQRFGYLCLLEGRVSVLSPLWISADGMKAYLVLLDESAHPVTPEMLHQCLTDSGVVFGINDEKVERKAAEIREGTQERGMFLIAEGQPQAEGEDAQIEIEVDLERRAGKIQDDGSIDFREVNFTPSINANQLVAKRRPATRGTPGKDVKGNVLEAGDGEDKPLKAGKNMRVEREGATELYFSTIDGAVRYERDELFAVEQLFVKGDVSFHTGNLNFGGEVVVDGSILQGFSVRAGGSLTITGTVEAGATVGVRGDVTVGKGIVGRKTKVVAGGSVQAQFVQEATVISGGDMVLGNYAYHAQIQCGGKLTVKSGAGTRGGSLMGGQTWAIRGIEAHLVGTKAGSETIVVCGVNQEQVRKLDKGNAGLEVCSEHITKILKSFGLTQIDMTQIKNMLAASTGPRRKILSQRAHQLGKLAQITQQLLAQKKLLEEELEDSSGAEIKVARTVFPGTTIRIGDYRRKIVDEMKGARFHVADEKLMAG